MEFINQKHGNMQTQEKATGGGSQILSKALTNEKLKKQGFPTTTERYLKIH